MALPTSLLCDDLFNGSQHEGVDGDGDALKSMNPRA